MSETSRKHFDTMYQHTVRNPDGYSIAVNPDGTTVERDTQQCCHCGSHFDVVPGSGRVRGFCTKCMKVTCGNHNCNEHFSLEERMDLAEKGLLPDLMAPRELILPKHKKIILE